MGLSICQVTQDLRRELAVMGMQDARDRALEEPIDLIEDALKSLSSAKGAMTAEIGVKHIKEALTSIQEAAGQLEYHVREQ